MYERSVKLLQRRTMGNRKEMSWGEKSHDRTFYRYKGGSCAKWEAVQGQADLKNGARGPSGRKISDSS